MTAATALSRPADVLSDVERRDAGKMSLRNGPRSSEARQLVQSFMNNAVLPAWPIGSARRPTSIAASERALGALLADLLELEAAGRAGAYGASPKDFTILPFGRDIFIRVRDALEAAGHLTVHKGRQQLHRFTNRLTGQPGPVLTGGGEVSRYRLTAAALELVDGAGVDLADWASHWRRRATVKAGKLSKAPLLVVRAQAERVYGEKSRGRDLSVDLAHPRAAEFLQDLEEHNAFVLAAGVDGIAYRGSRRIFNDGDQPGFAWQWGGSFISLPGGEGPEGLSGDDRRSLITIGGERVGEVDMRACQLSILYALEGLAFDPDALDPYALAGLDRALVKEWAVKAVGTGKVNYARWSKGALAYYAKAQPGRRLEKDHPIATVREATVARHPVLRSLGSAGRTALDLQFHQSEVMRAAMKRLRQAGVASLSVHDSLLVAINALPAASAAIVGAFLAYMEAAAGRPCSVKPAVRIKGQEGLTGL